ncbi:Pre-mRNA-splicing factor ISY1-like [Papilio machaon]|uniref:Pre-mRNA-splicing factor ISY1-like n=1 Tax=Papilio machaon TaxID=76193 RepID=A0A194R1X2_PAPMA|nr:Pre-mRNA-splicing factor ISY1-like [Papilio machaon]
MYVYRLNLHIFFLPAGLGEFRIRDLNDEINKLMREKRHWEVQIKSLGGPDHARVGPRMLDQDGKEVPGNRGYKYFGAAKDLPGVRELFEQEPPPPARRTRADLMRDVDADYYGYRDDDDGLLLPLEKDAERHAIARAVEEWKRNKEQNKEQDLPEEENIYPEDPDDKRIEDDEEMTEKSSAPTLIAVPSQKDVEEALLRRKKQELLERYGCLDVKLENS